MTRSFAIETYQALRSGDMCQNRQRPIHVKRQCLAVLLGSPVPNSEEVRRLSAYYSIHQHQSVTVSRGRLVFLLLPYVYRSSYTDHDASCPFLICSSKKRTEIPVGVITMVRTKSTRERDSARQLIRASLAARFSSGLATRVINDIMVRHVRSATWNNVRAAKAVIVQRIPPYASNEMHPCACAIVTS